MSDPNDLKLRKAWRIGYAEGYKHGLLVSFVGIVALSALFHLGIAIMGYS